MRRKMGTDVFEQDGEDAWRSGSMSNALTTALSLRSSAIQSRHPKLRSHAILLTGARGGFG